MPKQPRTTRFLVTIRTAQHGGDGDLPGFLDMLRYEGGQVVGWNRVGSDSFEVSIVVEALRHVPDRWKSFGIYPVEVFA